MYLYMYICIYVYISLSFFKSECTIKGINHCFTLALFYETIEYVDNAWCTVLVVPSMWVNMTLM